MNEKLLDETAYRKEVEKIKAYYSIMFGGNSYDYYVYCNLKKYDYGSLSSLIAFSYVLDCIKKTPEQIVMDFIDDDENKTSNYEKKAFMIEYEGYKKYCYENEYDQYSILSYTKYLEENGIDIINFV